MMAHTFSDSSHHSESNDMQHAYVLTSRLGVMAQTPIFDNGRLISIITQIAQRCQAGINRILNLYPSKITNRQKNFVGTPKPRSREKEIFTTGLSCLQAWQQ